MLPDNIPDPLFSDQTQQSNPSVLHFPVAQVGDIYLPVFPQGRLQYGKKGKTLFGWKPSFIVYMNTLVKIVGGRVCIRSCSRLQLARGKRVILMNTESL
ncbi:hypothetical protein D3C74_402750 [compost metagenome]